MSNKNLKTELDIIREVSKRCGASLILSEYETTHRKMNDGMTFNKVGDITHMWRAAIINNDEMSNATSQFNASKNSTSGTGGVICGMSGGVSNEPSNPYLQRLPKTHVLFGVGLSRNEAISNLTEKLISDEDIKLIASNGTFVKIPAASSAPELKLKLDVLDPL